ncbi:MAG: M3 family metallopeptidase [Gammaproteobacteria bacterium]|jgi:peptidyl-dipeptidase Dcp
MRLKTTVLTLAVFLLPHFAADSAAASGEALMETDNENIFFEEWDTPFGIPPFDRIGDEDFRPALEAGFEAQRERITAILANPEPPDFENSILALELSGTELSRVWSVFSNLTSTDTNETLDALELEFKPRYTRQQDAIYLDPALFARVDAVYQSLDEAELDPEQRRLAELTHRDFVRSGAALPLETREQLKEINARLSELSARFGQNLRAETKNFELVITDEADLAGLPSDVVSAARQAAISRGHQDAWVFGLDRSSFEAFMTYADNRDLRRRLFDGYRSRGAQGNEFDNRGILLEIAWLRARRAGLMGYSTHADYQLAVNMAKTPQRATEFLLQVWKPGLERARGELVDMEGQAFGDGVKDFQGWDWWYYAQRVRELRFSLDDDVLKPYFELSRVQEGAFYTANRLFGITFHPLADVPVWHPDVEAFEVRNPDGSHLGIFMVDYYARDSKKGGAWMSTYRDASDIDHPVRPIVTNNLNLIKPGEGQPTLLSFDESETLFHEFGHALQGLLTTVRFERFSGTSGLPRDYVELCSQVLEHWARAPEVLSVYARHYQTGEVIPDTLMSRIEASSTFNQGFGTTEYIAASLLDLAWHTMTAEETTGISDARAFEAETLGDYGLIPQIEPRYRSPYFAHIFSGGYSAGYYAYLWAETLDADAFTAFTESGDVFDPELAKRFKKYIFEAGGREEPEILYRKFRGRDPDIQPLLKIRGLGDD